MKNLLIFVILIGTLNIASCSKGRDNTAQNLVLLRHKWNIVFVEGEALHYSGKPGDYYNFSPNNMLYISRDNFLDTMAYSLASQNVLLLYPVTNGVQSATPATYSITNLSDDALEIKGGSNNPPISVDISLSR